MITYILLLGACFTAEQGNNDQPHSSKINENPSINPYTDKITKRLEEHWPRVCRESDTWMPTAINEIDHDKKANDHNNWKDSRTDVNKKRDLRNGQIDETKRVCDGRELNKNLSKTIKNPKIDKVFNSFEPFYLYHGMHTGSSNLYDFIHYIRKAVGDSNKNRPYINPDFLVLRNLF